jgi:ubiquinone/menaquinone biosynthesis C-methylase UbiE
MDYLEEIDYTHTEFGDIYDELPLWSAPFGLLLLEHVPIKQGITILDVGAGTGFLSIELAQRCGSDALVIAVDSWDSAIKRLQRKLDYLHIRNVRLITGDAEDVDLLDQSIDVIVSNLGINNFKNPEKSLRTCFRVAKPDGRLVLTTNLVGHMHEFYDVFRETFIDMKLEDRLAVFDEHVSHRGTVKSVGEMLVRAGFDITDVSTDSFTMRFADGSSLLRHYFIRLGFLPGWKSIIANEVVEDTFKALEQRLNEYASKRGELLLTIPMACFEARK